jgi:hypothetical protein
MRIGCWRDRETHVAAPRASRAFRLDFPYSDALEVRVPGARTAPSRWLVLIFARVNSYSLRRPE